MPYLEVRNLTTTFSMPGDIVVNAVNDVSFSLEKGRVYALLGESRVRQECHLTLYPSRAARKASKRFR